VKFKKPCLDCGSLSYENRCPRHMSIYNARRAERFNSINRKEKKKNLYTPEYQRAAKQLRQSATNCYLCGEAFTDRTQIQIDHVFPSRADTPLAPSHATCNRTKSDTPYDPLAWPNGVEIAKKYFPSFFRTQSNE
jgi:hypothetical protein